MRLALLVAIAACGGKAPPAPPPVANTPPPAPVDAAPADSPIYTKLVGEFTALSDAMCTCTTKACAKKVSDDMATWSPANEKNHTSFENLTPDQQTRVDDLGSRMGDCMVKIK